ncbi:MAG: hypothetical protein C5B43_01725 [Verrucomicrobia bacterium]|nr:MAG: hypothetical protein C5B43_01725 [Verrucomicrobiota bacterium]
MNVQERKNNTEIAKARNEGLVSEAGDVSYVKRRRPQAFNVNNFSDFEIKQDNSLSERSCESSNKNGIVIYVSDVVNQITIQKSDHIFNKTDLILKIDDLNYLKQLEEITSKNNFTEVQKLIFKNIKELDFTDIEVEDEVIEQILSIVTNVESNESNEYFPKFTTISFGYISTPLTLENSQIKTLNFKRYIAEDVILTIRNLPLLSELLFKINGQWNPIYETSKNTEFSRSLTLQNLPELSSVSFDLNFYNWVISNLPKMKELYLPCGRRFEFSDLTSLDSLIIDSLPSETIFDLDSIFINKSDNLRNVVIKSIHENAVFNFGSCNCKQLYYLKIKEVKGRICFYDYSEDENLYRSKIFNNLWTIFMGNIDMMNELIFSKLDNLTFVTLGNIGKGGALISLCHRLTKIVLGNIYSNVHLFGLKNLKTLTIKNIAFSEKQSISTRGYLQLFGLQKLENLCIGNIERGCVLLFGTFNSLLDFQRGEDRRNILDRLPLLLFEARRAFLKYQLLILLTLSLFLIFLIDRSRE